jgi:hypothetical protein
MRTIIFSSGPSAMPQMNYSQQNACKKLRQFVTGQVDFIANDCSWVPSVLDFPQNMTGIPNEGLEDIKVDTIDAQSLRGP